MAELLGSTGSISTKAAVWAVAAVCQSYREAPPSLPHVPWCVHSRAHAHICISARGCSVEVAGRVHACKRAHAHMWLQHAKPAGRVCHQRSSADDAERA